MNANTIDDDAEISQESHNQMDAKSNLDSIVHNSKKCGKISTCDAHKNLPS